MLSTAALFGLGMAIFIPLWFAIAPAEVIGDQYGFAFGLTMIMTISGLVTMALAGMAAVQAFRTNVGGWSHLEAIISFAVIAVFVFLLAHATQNIFERGNQLEQESRILATKVIQGQGVNIGE